MRQPKSDRRKVNVPTGGERRSVGKDKRHCPNCHSALQSSIEAFAGGTYTTTFCTKCDYKAMSKQIDEDRMRSLLGFEAEVLGNARKPMLELSAEFLKASGIKPGDTLELKPIFTPGSKKQLSWVLKKIEE
jgi:hypothetical protein